MIALDRCSRGIIWAAIAVAAFAVLALLLMSSRASAESVDLAVPYHPQQRTWYCGEACLEMVFDYWGEDVPQDDIGDVANESAFAGTYADDLARAAVFSNVSTSVQGREGGGPPLQGYDQRGLGYAAYRKNWLRGPGPSTGREDLQQILREGYPVILLVWFDTSHMTMHFVVLEGFDTDEGTFLMDDPLRGADRGVNGTLLVDDLWTCSDQWGMVVAPWSLEVSAPAMVGPGDGFNVSARVEIRCPTPLRSLPVDYWAQLPYVTLRPSAPLALAKGENGAKSLYVSGYGDNDTATWRLVAPWGDGVYACDVVVVAQATVWGSSQSYWWYSDAIGAASTARVLCDCAPPRIAALEVAGGATVVSARAVPIVYALTDEGSGVDAVAFSTNAGATWGPWTYPNGTAWVHLDAGDGVYRVGLRAMDMFGNLVKEFRTVVLDTEPPTIDTFSLADGAAVVAVGTVPARLVARDARTDVEAMSFRIDSGRWSDWEPYAEQPVLAIQSDGGHVVEARVRDAAGNIAGANASITVDSTPPTIRTFAVEGGARFSCSRTVRLVINASDDLAPELEWALVETADGSHSFDPSRLIASGSEAVVELALSGEGLRSLQLFVMDWAGHVTDASLDVMVDTRRPAVALELADGHALVNTTIVQAMVSASDPGGELAGVRMRVDGGEWRPLQPPLGRMDLELGGGEGRRTVEVEAVDLAGNTARANATVWVDTVAPTGRVDLTGRLPDGKVAMDTWAIIEFSEPMDASNVRVVLIDQGGMNIGCVVNWTNGTSALEVRPLKHLAPGAQYRLQYIGRDPAGNLLGPVDVALSTPAEKPTPVHLSGNASLSLGLLVACAVAVAAIAGIALLRRR